MSFLPLLPRRPLLIGLTTGLFTSTLLLPRRRLLFCDGPLLSSSSSPSSILSDYTSSAKTPVITREGKANTNAYKQISLGSILGVVGGVAVGSFSKTIAFFLGLVIVGVQFAASRGVNILPTQRIQKYVKGIDLRSAVMDNVAFKMSFGLTFMLAGFAHFDNGT